MKLLFTILLSISLSTTFGQWMAMEDAPEKTPASAHAAILLKAQAIPGHYVFTQGSSQIIQGNIPEGPVAPAQANDFQVIILDHLRNPMDTIVIHKPFQPAKPVANPNLDGKYRLDTKESHQSMIRFNYSPEMKFMMVNLVGKSGTTTPLAFLPITFEN